MKNQHQPETEAAAVRRLRAELTQLRWESSAQMYVINMALDDFGADSATLAAVIHAMKYVAARAARFDDRPPLRAPARLVAAGPVVGKPDTPAAAMPANGSEVLS